MKKTVHKHTTLINLVLGGIVVLLVALLLFLPSPTNGPSLGELTFPSGKQISIEVADNALSRAKGLSGRAQIDDSYGMLFLFPELNTPSFWMKGMNFPLDMIWIRGETIVEITKEVPLESGIHFSTYSPSEPVDKVLEVRAGFTEEYGVKIGDTLEIVLPE